MQINKGLFTSLSPHWATPKGLYQELDAEFKFNDDPCPLHSKEDGLARAWGTSTFVNPPYGREIGKWISKAYEESKQGKTIVMLIPSRTDTAWWHDYVMKAEQIRFIRGRLKFVRSSERESYSGSAPFPSCIAIFKGNISKCNSDI